MTTLFARYRGYLRVEVRGRWPERFVNLAATRGIELWDIARANGTLSMLVSVADFRALRPVARGSRCRVHIVQRYGLPFVLSALLRRRGALAGGLLCLLIICTFSSFIWSIEVEGLETRSPEEVLSAARELGLAPGSLRWGLDSGSLAQELALRLRFASWVGVQMRGTRLTITVAEKAQLEEEGRPARAAVVAARAGLVRDVLVLSGVAAVKAGDTVEPGDVLINPSSPAGGLAPEAARGSVWASVWYESCVQMPLVEEFHTPGPGRWVRAVIRVAGHEAVIRGWGDPPFETYESSETRQRWDLALPGGRIDLGTVEVITTRYREMVKATRRHSPQQARQIARLKAQQEIAGRIPPGARIEKTEWRVLGETPEHVTVRVLVCTLEDIGRPGRASVQK